MPETATPEDAYREFTRLTHGIPVAMLTTTGLGRLRSRPMVTQKTAFDGHLWFLTAREAGKTGEIRDRQQVHATFVSPADDRYVWATGTAAIVDDPGMLQTLWHDGYAPWFPKGPGDASIALIRVRVEEAAYWDRRTGRMVPLAGLAAPGTSFHELEPGMGI